MVRTVVGFSVTVGATMLAMARAETADSAVRVFAGSRDGVVYFYSRGKNSAGDEIAFSGSGFLISNDGYILTNNHVIDTKAFSGTVNQVLSISSKGPEWYNYSVVARDTKNDLALVKIKPNKQLKALPYAVSDKIVPGSKVFVMGYPGAWDLSISQGIISNLNGFNGTWQTDSSINPGNSGGPVLDESGSVVAVVVSKGNRSDGLPEDGIGFIIPIKTAIQGVLKTVPNLRSVVKPQTIEDKKPDTYSKSYDISIIKDDHPVVFASHTKSYTLRYEAEAGYRFDSASLVVFSSTKADVGSTKISSDGKYIDILLKITSGPQVDQWRGWYQATLVTKMNKIK